VGPNAESNGYLVIDASGGLNQQRTGVIFFILAANSSPLIELCN
jgi:hypothetical protein